MRLGIKNGNVSRIGMIELLSALRSGGRVRFQNKEELRELLYEYLNPDIRDELVDLNADKLWEQYGDQIICHIDNVGMLWFSTYRHGMDVFEYSSYVQYEEINESDISLDVLFMKS